MEKKLVADSFLILVDNMKQPLHERNFVENKIFWKRIFNKSSKSQQYFFIRLQSFLMHKTFKSKRDLALMTSLSSGYETHSKTFFLIIFYLIKSDDLIWSSFWVIPKAPSATLCKPVHDSINYSISIWRF